jgi:hypothetical protein
VPALAVRFTAAEAEAVWRVFAPLDAALREAGNNIETPSMTLFFYGPPDLGVEENPLNTPPPEGAMAGKHFVVGIR